MRIGLRGLLYTTLLPLSVAAADTPPAGLTPSACYSTHEISVKSDAPGITLAGDFTVPAGKGPFPAVQMITGSGPHTRDEMISLSPTFRFIAEFFARHGIAVLRTDARGFGKSTGPANTEAYTTADRAVDNRAIYRFLKAQKKVEPHKLMLFGHSEGAMIAVMMAARDTSPALVMLMGPSALPGDEVLAGQMTDNLIRRGADKKTAAAVHAQLLRFFDLLVHDPDNHQRFARIANDFLAAHGVAREKIDPHFAQSLLSGYFKSKWDRYFASYDPRHDLQNVQSPVAAFLGDKDENVPWRRHLSVLVSAFATGKVTDLGIHVIPDQDHFFLEYNGTRVEKHHPGEMRISTELLDAMKAELKLHGLLGVACRD